MAGKIFVSCGQANDEEQKVAKELKKLLSDKGFKPFVAKESQSLQDINFEIINNLKSADYYIFIDFKREQINTLQNNFPEYRGSLFTNQELMLSYFLGFEKVLFLKQDGVRLEGIGKYLLSNALAFKEYSEVPGIIEDEINKRNWITTYSRHLLIREVKLTGIFPFGDHTGRKEHYIWHIFINNQREDIAASNTVALLSDITLPDGNRIPSPDRQFLKWSGQAGFVGFHRTILPKDTVELDLMSIEKNNLNHVYLHSAFDMHPRQPIIKTPGNYVLHYKIFSQEFPLLEADVSLFLTGDINTTKVEIK